ncbi:TatD family hydrolase [Candidatus Daviesbacteria bacterium]|nr:TatD family hydrolase [Candidatus Daviesbacteria bacterium]
MLIDTHAHLEFDSFAKDYLEVIDRARSVGVGIIINVGTTQTASQQAIDLAQKHDYIYATVGTHPIDLGKTVDIDINKMRQLAQSKKVVAIGECGLDYSRPNIKPPHEQEKIFSLQIQLAHQLRLPLIIHCREAWNDIFPFLKTQLLAQLAPPGVFHCFTGNQDQAKAALELGFFISFACIVTYPKNQYLRDIIKILPLDKILVETDSPFLPPQSQRGQRNEPANVAEVAKIIAQVKNTTFDQVAGQTTKNAKQLFRL